MCVVGILLTCAKHLHGRIVSFRVAIWSHKTNLTPTLLIEVPVPSQEIILKNENKKQFSVI